jgi:hypothetical protein
MLLSVVWGLIGCGAAQAVLGAEAGRGAFVFACTADNDLYRVMVAQGLDCQRYDDPAEAVRCAPAGAGILILAEDYPEDLTAVYGEVLDHLAEKRLRCYLEFPCQLPGLKPDRVQGIPRARAVVTSDAFGPELPPMSILSINSCRFIAFEGVKKPHLVLAKVAGFDTAVYGLPKETWPILFEHERGDLLVATTKLSHFIRGRYGPQDSWQAVWKMVLHWLQPDAERTVLAWTPLVRPAFGKLDPLPADVEKQALDRSLAWFRRTLDLPMHRALRDRTDPSRPAESGYFECYSSSIRLDGSQPLGEGERSDCNGEAMMAFAMGQKLRQDALCGRVASNIGDHLYFFSRNAKGPRAHPESPSYGLLGWANNSPDVYYTDDNARCLLGTIGCAALLGTDRWDENVARSLTANFRLCSPNGFQPSSTNDQQLQRNGWRYYHGRPAAIEHSPHYVSWIWACYLWGYQQSGYEPFLVQVRKGIRTLMEGYADRWRWTNGIQQERARLLLPLAWLVRVEDTPEHRAWLMTIARDLIADQVACGAIREELGDLGKGIYPPPQNNADFGEHEASLIQTNGNPACDLLYTANFAFLSLHEAAAATGEPLLRDAENKLAEYLCRVQIRSEARPELDGGWYRGFDFDRWDYWASDADAGWGVWCIESGWTQAWITSVLGLRQLNTSYWDLTGQRGAKVPIRKYVKQMLPTP